MTDLDVIQENLGTGSAGEGHGAYQCEYAVFKRLVQLERRGVERSGDSVYLCLLTVGDRKGRTLKPEIQTRAMERPEGIHPEIPSFQRRICTLQCQPVHPASVFRHL